MLWNACEQTLGGVPTGRANVPATKCMRNTIFLFRMDIHISEDHSDRDIDVRFLLITQHRFGLKSVLKSVLCTNGIQRDLVDVDPHPG